MVEILKERLGQARAVVYILAVGLLFIDPVSIWGMIVKFSTICLLILLLHFLYQKCNYYNRNYEIPDILCLLSLTSQTGHLLWESINRYVA
ncbi:hypothetical protein SAMN05660841_00397 [Sphingobacterium nematocida]|uniref:Uncharacterized protein n=1 Tax=Sphingobacterium nematocida TaxID=1513896 RepID=A0A1T5B203_9SPHI|nr:hypothetical protein SAMN05660841_00397 [Sphingobacterium nematocida]